MSLKDKNAAEMTAFELLVGMLAQGLAQREGITTSEVGRRAVTIAEEINGRLSGTRVL